MARRRGHTEEQILAALRQAESGTAVAEICREVGISEQTFYVWKRKYAGLGLRAVLLSRAVLSSPAAAVYCRGSDWVWCGRSKSVCTGTIDIEHGHGFKALRFSKKLGMKQYYCRWDEDDIEGLHSISEIASLYTESNEQGLVLREIGLDKFGKVTHRYPSSAHPFGSRGTFDTQTIKLSEKTRTLTKEEFEALWRLM